MAGKVFLKRDIFKKQSNVYFKYFLWAAVGLIILVVVTPLLTHRRSDKASQKVTPETGMVMKEIPKSPPAGSEGVQPSQESAAPDGIKEATVGLESAATQAVPPGGQTSHPAGPTENLQGGAGVAPAEPLAEQGQMASLAEPQPSAVPSEPIGGGSPAPQSAQPAAQGVVEAGKAQPQQAASVAAEPAAAPPQTAKPAEKPPAGGTTKYIVQIGSFSQKQNAESIQQTLAKKGYEVVVRTLDHAKFGRLYVVQLAAVYDPVKAESLLAKVRKEANIKPMVVKVPAEQ